MRRVSFDVFMITVLFAAISILHITIPVVVSVETVTQMVDASSNAATMPGQILALGIGQVGQYGVQDLSEELKNSLATIPYLYGQRNNSAIDLPNGFNNSFVSSLPLDISDIDAISRISQCLLQLAVPVSWE